MDSNQLALIIIVAMIIIVAIIGLIQLIILLRKPNSERELINTVNSRIQEGQALSEQSSRAMREEMGKQIDRLRDSMVSSLTVIKDTQQSQQNSFTSNVTSSINKMHTDVDSKLMASYENQASKLSELKDQLNVKLDASKDTLNEKLDEFRRTQVENSNYSVKSSTESIDKMRDNLDLKLSEFIESQSRKLTILTESNSNSLESVRNKVDERLNLMQLSNEKKLDEMRQTVDEKLEKTLDSRLQKSFETVSMQLESVNRGLGEMKTVADSVGSLNKVLSNSKTRGILGELQLGRIIEDILPSSLYEREIPTIPYSSERVEYAIKFPGNTDSNYVYLPIDSKFPLEDYYRLEEGYESGDRELIETSRKALLARIKTFAKDIKNKYVSPPYTMNFAILFVPTEGLYSEVVRDASFINNLRQEGVMISGPSTLAALLNSLQLGFKTLQIQKSAADIERTLGNVKREFIKFEDILTKAHRKITQAGSDIETLVSTRTRAINRSLSEIQIYDEDKTKYLSEDEMLVTEGDSDQSLIDE